MYSSLRKTHRIAMKRQVPRGITQDYLPHNKGKRAPAPHLNPSQTGQYLIYLPRRNGRLS